MDDRVVGNHLPRKQVVLISLCGLSPAVITETVWALTREQTPTRVNKVVALTTGQGKEAIIRCLFADNSWNHLRKALKADPSEMVFGVGGDSIRVIPNAEAGELTDIISSEDSCFAADFILETLRQ